MRTTLNLDDHLMQRARERARQRGLTLTRLIENALARELTDPDEARGLRLRPFAGARALDLDVADREALYGAFDAS